MRGIVDIMKGLEDHMKFAVDKVKSINNDKSL
jgi:hypothetical protein